MKAIILFTATFFLSGSSHHAFLAQANTTSCPIISIVGPELSADKRQKYSVNIEGGDSAVNPTFKWTSSSGKIIDGQGTREMLIDAGGTNYITVTVEVGGYPASCKTVASSSQIIEKSTARKFAEYGDLSFTGERARLDMFVAELQNEPTAQGYILVYAGRRSSRGEAKRMGERAKDYLVRQHDIKESRIVVVDGGNKKERMVELFIVPAGAEPPTVTPAGQPKE